MQLAVIPQHGAALVSLEFSLLLAEHERLSRLDVEHFTAWQRDLCGDVELSGLDSLFRQQKLVKVKQLL